MIMSRNHESVTSSDNRQTVFGGLKQQQISLNMQIRLAMQLHDTNTQKKLEKEMAEITERINCFSH